MKLDKTRVLPIVKTALKEDIGRGDITTQSLINKFASSTAVITAKEECVVCGLEIAEWAMAQIDYSVRFKPNCGDGDTVGAGKEISFIEGHSASILRAERTMLNFLSILSGIATRTRQFVVKAKPYGVKILDTRKTVPLMRYLEKYAVSVGGGANHRMGLYDQILIKDNHIRGSGIGIRGSGAGEKTTLKSLVEKARKLGPKGVVIEIEAANIEEFNDALKGKPDIIMLDNMSPREVRACVELLTASRIKPLIEASGGITLDNIEEYAKTKVDMISVGSLTDSISAIDMSLEIV